MKIIFLDIDGVLNFEASAARTPSGLLGIVDKKVKLLKRIIDKTNAKVVLISSWRKSWSNEYGGKALNKDGQYMIDKFERQGIHILDKIDDMYMAKERLEAINEYLKKHEYVTNYVVLDDDAIYYLFDATKEEASHYIIISYNEGLNETQVNEAIEILNKGD